MTKFHTRYIGQSFLGQYVISRGMPSNIYLVKTLTKKGHRFIAQPFGLKQDVLELKVARYRLATAAEIARCVAARIQS